MYRLKTAPHVFLTKNTHCRGSYLEVYIWVTVGHLLETHRRLCQIPLFLLSLCCLCKIGHWKRNKSNGCLWGSQNREVKYCKETMKRSSRRIKQEAGGKKGSAGVMGEERQRRGCLGRAGARSGWWKWGTAVMWIRRTEKDWRAWDRKGVKKTGGKGQEGKRNHGTVIKAKPEVEGEAAEANRKETMKENSETNFMAQPWTQLWSWIGRQKGTVQKHSFPSSWLGVCPDDFCWQERGGGWKIATP